MGNGELGFVFACEFVGKAFRGRGTFGLVALG